MVSRYGVYWVNLDPVIGREMAKRRPALVISDDAMNRHLSTVVVCPLTSSRHPAWPSRVACSVGEVDGEIAVDQIRTVSRDRIGDRLGTIGDDEAAAVRHVITEMYGILAVSVGE